MVKDVDGLVKDLKAKGVAFEHYDLPGLTRKGDVHVAGTHKNAWFKDPDGNILAWVGGGDGWPTHAPRSMPISRHSSLLIGFWPCATSPCTDSSRS